VQYCSTQINLDGPEMAHVALAKWNAVWHAAWRGIAFCFATHTHGKRYVLIARQCFVKRREEIFGLGFLCLLSWLSVLYNHWLSSAGTGVQSTRHQRRRHEHWPAPVIQKHLLCEWTVDRTIIAKSLIIDTSLCLCVAWTSSGFTMSLFYNIL